MIIILMAQTSWVVHIMAYSIQASLIKLVLLLLLLYSKRTVKLTVVSLCNVTLLLSTLVWSHFEMIHGSTHKHWGTKYDSCVLSYVTSDLCFTFAFSSWKAFCLSWSFLYITYLLFGVLLALFSQSKVCSSGKSLQLLLLLIIKWFFLYS